MEKRGVPTSTIISAAFLGHARLAAKNIRMEDLPLVITPHPLNDLTQEQVRDLARAAYPLILADLTQQGPIAREAYVDYVHPGARSRQVQQQARAQAAQAAPRAR